MGQGIRQGRQLSSTFTSGSASLQAVLPIKSLSLVGLRNWAGLLAGLCNCSWPSGNSDCALQLYGGCGWTL